MLKIRLARIGKKKHPTYKLIVSEGQRDTWGDNLETVGTMDPFNNVVAVNKDRILYWISKGAQLSPTVHNLMVDQNVITEKKVVASAKGKKAEAARLAEIAAKNAPKPAEPEAAPAAEEAPAEAAAETPVEAAPEPAAEEAKTE
jgi:small subunit ribosomal protein S16